MKLTLDLSHVPGRIRVVPIPEWPGLWHWGLEDWHKDGPGMPMMWHSPKGGRVSCTAYVDFDRGSQFSRFLWTPETYEQQVSVLQRIESIQGLPWHLTAANCEQVVRWAVEGKPRSMQLEVGFFTAVGAALLLAFAMKGKLTSF